jgi:hypothetical protein
MKKKLVFFFWSTGVIIVDSNINNVRILREGWEIGSLGVEEELDRLCEVTFEVGFLTPLVLMINLFLVMLKNSLHLTSS